MASSKVIPPPYPVSTFTPQQGFKIGFWDVNKTYYEGFYIDGEFVDVDGPVGAVVAYIYI